MIELIVIVCALQAGCQTIHVKSEADSLDNCHALWVMAREQAARDMKVAEGELNIKELTCGRTESETRPGTKGRQGTG